MHIHVVLIVLVYLMYLGIYLSLSMGIGYYTVDTVHTFQIHIDKNVRWDTAFLFQQTRAEYSQEEL